MAETIYVLCFLSSLAASGLLMRAYFATHQRILLWTGLGFVFICLNNLLLIVDLLVIPDTDMSPIRHVTTLVGASLIVFGLVWDHD